MTYAGKWSDFPDYILEITEEIWRGRAIENLHRYYAEDIPVRTPMGTQRGNQPVIAATMAMLTEFPDRQGNAEDVIWSNHPEHGYLSSHRGVSTMTHNRDGQFGPGTGKKLIFSVIADCAARDETIYDEWLVRDYGAIVRQLDWTPQEYARRLIITEGGPENASRPFLPENDIEGDYKGRGNDNEWGARYADILRKIMDKDFAHIRRTYDRSMQGVYAGGRRAIGVANAVDFWLNLRSAFPSAKFEIHHQIGMDADMLSPRAAIRWSLDGTHDGWGPFGRPTGKRVHVMGISHAEFGPWGLRRETALYDEVAIWKQILLQTGDA